MCNLIFNVEHFRGEALLRDLSTHAEAALRTFGEKMNELSINKTLQFTKFQIIFGLPDGVMETMLIHPHGPFPRRPGFGFFSMGHATDAEECSPSES